MISLLIGVGSGIVLIILAVFGIVVARARPDGTKGARPDFEIALSAVSLATVILPGCIVCGWGGYEVVFAGLNVGLFQSHPASWAFWLACGLADGGSAIMFYVFGGIALFILVSPTRKAALARWRSRLGIPAIAVGGFQVAMSIAYFVF